MAELSFKEDGRILFTQDGQKYDLNHLPEGFVIKGDVDLSNKELTELPDLSKVIVEGNFDCSYNQLTSLAGAPEKIGGNIYSGSDFLNVAYIKQAGRTYSLAQGTKPEDAPKLVGGAYVAGLKGCLYEAAQGVSTETQDRPHAKGVTKVTSARPGIKPVKRMSGKRGPRD